MATTEQQRIMVKQAQKQFQAKRELLGVRKLQEQISTRAPARGGVWISQDSFQTARGSTNLPSILQRVILDLSLPTVDHLPLPTANEKIELEWIGQQKKNNDTHVAPTTDEQIFERLCADTDSNTTVLYAHGGAFYGGSPTYSRPATTKLAKLTRGRVVSVAYSLAPQRPFPAALQDLLLVWLNLLHDGTRHRAVSPENVVFAGDSAGGNLVLAMTQAILRIRAMDGYGGIYFNGKIVDLPLPSGVAVLSAFVDQSMGLPSWTQNGHVDILGSITPALTAQQPVDEVWPTSPPRGDPYCHPSAWLHPLVCPNLAVSWHGSPPMYFAMGQERCADGVKMLAAQAARDGVTVRYEEYRGMPHIFPVILPKLPQAQRCMKNWADACLGFVRGAGSLLESRGVIVHMPGDREEFVDVRDVAPIRREDMLVLVEEAAKERKPWTGPTARL
ncbi:hypothetical protein Q7P37_005930 [Cladosporium fusiforme]